MNHQECPHGDDCEIIEVDNEGNESPYDKKTSQLEIESPGYKCKTHGNLFYERELTQ